MTTLNWPNQEAARKWVKSFLVHLERPCVVLLSGDLGAGKTQLVKWFLSELGMKETASPTFAILQEYGDEENRVDHVDLYRLESDSDLESCGFWDLFLQVNGLVFVEWADRLPPTVWPKDWTHIFIHLKVGKGGEESRVMEYKIEPPKA